MRTQSYKCLARIMRTPGSSADGKALSYQNLKVIDTAMNLGFRH